MSGAASGVSGQLLGAAGVMWLANKTKWGGGLAKLTYQVASTTTVSIVDNLAGGYAWNERINVGVGPFTFVLRDGKLSLSPLDNINNILTVIGNLRGLTAAIAGLAKIKPN